MLIIKKEIKERKNLKKNHQQILQMVFLGKIFRKVILLKIIIISNICVKSINNEINIKLLFRSE